MTAPATQPHEDDILGKAYDRKLMSRLLVYARPYRALMYGAFALLCVEGGIQVVGPLLTRRVIDVAVPAHDMSIVAICTALFFVALLTEFITSYGQTWLTSLLGQRVMRDLRMEIFRHLQRLSVSYFDRNPRAHRQDQLVPSGTTDRHAHRAAVRAGEAGGPALRRAQSHASGCAAQVDHHLRSLFSGNRAADIDRPGDPHRRRRITRPRQ